MKLAEVLDTIAPFLATDKKPEEVKAAILAADKAAKDKAAKDAKADNVAETKEIEKTDHVADKAAKDKAAKDKAAKDKAAKDRNDDPEHTNDEEVAEDEDYTEGADPTAAAHGKGKQMPAVDSATVSKMIADAVAARDALHAARTDVGPLLGVTTFDSAPKTYREALKKLGVAHDELPDSALRTVLQLAVKNAAVTSATPVAMDSGARVAAAKAFPGINRLR